MEVLYSKKFLKMFGRLPIFLQERAAQKENIFKKYPFSKMLRTHKLHGKFEGCYAFSVDYKNRIIFEFIEKNTVSFIAIGDHSIYQ